jgi:GMC oxidoreductase
LLTTTIATSFNVTAMKEVILSAGSYGTPQLLLLSGIGDATDLEDLGIEPTVDLPSVGKNLTDHPLVNIIWNVTETTVIDVYASLSSLFISDLTCPFCSRSQNQTYQEEALNEWQVNKTGPLTNFGVHLLTWFRLPDAWPAWAQHEDPSAGSSSPHMEIMTYGMGGAYPLPGPTITSSLILLTPTSREYHASCKSPAAH